MPRDARHPLRFFAGVAAALVAFSAAPGAARATVLDPNFVEAELGLTVSLITGLAWAPDGTNRLFLTLKGGEVRIIENGRLLPEPFFTFSPVYTQSECGLLSLAFDPDFENNGAIVFFVTVSATEQRIVRLRATGNTGVDPTTLIGELPTRGANHDGGGLAFGPDGKLYFSIGDLGNYTGVGDDLTLLASKVSRVNRDGSVTAGNPYADGAGPADERVWARGFRNPFSMTFQPETERLWVNVVGDSYEQVFIVSAEDDARWPFYENNQPPEYLSPIIAFRTNTSDRLAIAANGAVRAGGVATFTVPGPLKLQLGMQVTVTDVADTSFNGVGFVESVPSSTSFTMMQAGANAVSGGGTATTLDIGGCPTGGAFYDSTAGTADYRGNYFFGDYNSGRLTRARLSGSRALSVETWGTERQYYVDMALGPDGDLYYTDHAAGDLRRARFRPTTQGIVVSKAHHFMIEGGTTTLGVRLGMEPSEPLDLLVEAPAGEDIEVIEGRELTFTASDWVVPQPVRFRAKQDADSVDDIVEVTVSSAGGLSESVTIRIIDELTGPDEPPPEGGAGGTPGGEGGLGGAETGGTAGAPSGGSSGSAGENAGQAGEGGGQAGENAGGMGGSPDGGTGTDGTSDDGSDGCGCGMSRQAGMPAGWLVLLALLVRRRARPASF